LQELAQPLILQPRGLRLGELRLGGAQLVAQLAILAPGLEIIADRLAESR
jgi:hypothetical protein